MLDKKYGYITLYRDLMNWEWYSEPNTFRLFIHCLLCANHKEKKWHGTINKTGSFVTSYAKLAKDLSISKRQIQVALKHLILSHYVSCKSTNRYSIISIKNYKEFQPNVTQNVHQMYNKCTTNVKQMYTTNKEYKEKKEKKEYCSYDVKNFFNKLREEAGIKENE